jgi:hypothetical protein
MQSPTLRLTKSIAIMDMLPDEILEAVIAQLVNTGTKPKHNDLRAHRRHVNNEQAAREDEVGCNFDFPALVSLATHSFTRIVHNHHAKLNTSALAYLSSLLTIRGKSLLSLIYDVRYADLLNTRLTCRTLLSAASPSFLAHIETHPWSLNAKSLTRLSNLLLFNPDLACQITRLRLNSYRFDLTDISVTNNDYEKHEVLAFLTRAMDTRSAYVKDELVSQLVDIFWHTKNLIGLFVTPELLKHDDKNYPSYPAHFTIFSRIARMPNPLDTLATALQMSHTHHRLLSFTSYTSVDYCFADSTPQQAHIQSLVCANLTHLTIDPAYFMDASFTLNCPALKRLEIMRVEKMPLQRIQKLLEREVGDSDDAAKRRTMYRGLKELVLTGMEDAVDRARSGMATATLYTSSIYALLAYVARYTDWLENVTIRRARICNDGTRDTNTPGAEEEKYGANFMALQDLNVDIGKLRLQDVQWRSNDWSGSKKIGGVEEVWERLGVLRACVGEVVISPDGNCTCSWERAMQLCAACEEERRQDAKDFEQDRRLGHLEKEWEDALTASHVP